LQAYRHARARDEIPAGSTAEPTHLSQLDGVAG